MGRMVDGSDLIYRSAGVSTPIRYTNNLKKIGGKMKKPPKDQELTAKVCAWASPFIMLFGITSASIAVFLIGLIFLVCGIWYLRD